MIIEANHVNMKIRIVPRMPITNKLMHQQAADMLANI